MARMFMRNTVNDYDSWRKAFDEHEHIRASGGVKQSGVFRSVDDPNEVIVWADFDTMDAAKGFGNSDGLRDAMKTAGVEKSIIWFGNET